MSRVPERFQVTVVVGAVLVFLVQPLAGKTILPAFGGTYSVWVTALLFFQLVMLMGYGMVHLVVGRRVTAWRRVTVIN